MTHRLAGKIAVVTGGATGIGFVSAKRFAAEDARVFITGRRQAELEVEWAWRTSCTRHLESDTRRFGNPPSESRLLSFGINGGQAQV
jgi:NAD(P)-dependent dehydrogenase (short-subunit alcohol dehydrogenase family)